MAESEKEPVAAWWEPPPMNRETLWAFVLGCAVGILSRLNT